MKHYFFISLVLISFLAKAQDIDIYKKTKNENYKLPAISQEMSFDEFEILSQNVRMKDMMYAGIVPGYIHFKAQDKKKGYWILGIRSASYISMFAAYLDFNHKYANQNLWDAKTSDQKVYQNVFIGAMTLALGTYFYDLIHGEHILHQKQEKIRFKYALKASKHPLSFQSNQLYPNLSLAIQL